MSITDELREWVHTSFVGFFSSGWERDLIAIADRIDAEHERMYEDLTIGMEPMTEDNMARDGWVQLPRDADGLPIHVGDELDGLHYEDGTVTGIQYGADGRAMVAIRPSGWDTSTWRDPEEYRHVQPDSWERIIGDALTIGWQNGNWNEVASAEVHDRLVERCRRLAGEAE